jgi:hypothetical protein
MNENTVALSGHRRLLLPLEDARVCLDCDLLTDSSVCPLCARDQTVWLSSWLRPLNAEPLPSRLTP